MAKLDTSRGGPRSKKKSTRTVQKFVSAVFPKAAKKAKEKRKKFEMTKKDFKKRSQATKSRFGV